MNHIHKYLNIFLVVVYELLEDGMTITKSLSLTEGDRRLRGNINGVLF